MELRVYHNFQPVTKRSIRGLARLKNSDELCGVASIVMLLHWCGSDDSFEDVYRRMLLSGAYVEGTGTYLQNVVKLYPGVMHYFRYMPLFFMRFLIGRRYVMAVSVNEQGGGSHIVFVCNSDRFRIYYYDPNKDESLQDIAHKKWHKISNRRALIMKCNI